MKVVAGTARSIPERSYSARQNIALHLPQIDAGSAPDESEGSSALRSHMRRVGRVPSYGSTFGAFGRHLRTARSSRSGWLATIWTHSPMDTSPSSANLVDSPHSSGSSFDCIHTPSPPTRTTLDRTQSTWLYISSQLRVEAVDVPPFGSETLEVEHATAKIATTASTTGRPVTCRTRLAWITIQLRAN